MANPPGTSIVPINDQPAAVQEGLLALNNRFAAETSYLTPEQWRDLTAIAFCARSADATAAFLVAIADDAAYDNFNFRWFNARLSGFAYVDRIIVDDRHQGRGLARQLYEALFDAARDRGLSRVVCEVNREPPNPGSDAFHARMGFEVIGESALPHADKVVRYLCKTLD